MSQRIGFIKPDYGVHGGFEVLIHQLVAGLQARGHDVEIIPVDATTRATHLYGLPVNGAFHQWHHEYFEYITITERVQHLSLDDFDLVVATQPPTWHADHDNVIGLFFHHGRVFYDLAEQFVASGFVDEEIHEAATAAIQSLDATVSGRVKHWLACSKTSADRLIDHWNIDPVRISPYHHPAFSKEASNPGPPTRSDSLLDSASVALVSRHEWPKRTELAVAAAQRMTGPTLLDCIGGGSRLPFVKDLDARLGVGEQIPDLELWQNRGPSSAGWEATDLDPSGRVTFHGALSDAERDTLTGSACAIVAPAHNEDYGLTALEAFAARKPLIVCRDGGGLTEFVTHEETGLVVEPSPIALAQAMDRLASDPTLAAELGQAGYELGRTFTLTSALDQFEAVLG